MKYFVLCLAVCSIVIGTSTQKTRNLQSPKPKAAVPATPKGLPPSTPNHPDRAGSPSQMAGTKGAIVHVLKKSATQIAEDATIAAVPTCDKWGAAWSLTTNKKNLDFWNIDLKTQKVMKVEQDEKMLYGGICNGTGSRTCCSSQMMMS